MQIKSIDEMETTDSGLITKARDELGIESFGLSIETFPAGFDGSEYPAHTHEDDQQEEAYFCSSGSGEVQTSEDGEWQEFQTGMLLSFKPGEFRRFRSTSGMQLLAISHPLTGEYQAPAWTNKGSSESETTSGSGSAA